MFQSVSLDFLHQHRLPALVTLRVQIPSSWLMFRAGLKVTCSESAMSLAAFVLRPFVGQQYVPSPSLHEYPEGVGFFPAQSVWRLSQILLVVSLNLVQKALTAALTLQRHDINFQFVRYL
jgi:hypothetical protein